MSSENTTTGKVILRQDLGILMFLISVIGGALITALAGRDLLAQNIVLMIGLFLILLLGSLRSNVAATIVTAVLILSFSVYKLYNHFAYSTAIERSAYLWPLLFVSALFGITPQPADRRTHGHGSPDRAGKPPQHDQFSETLYGFERAK